MLALVKLEFGIEFSLTTLGRHLKSWDDRAEARASAYERYDEAIAQWCRRTYRP